MKTFLIVVLFVSLGCNVALAQKYYGKDKNGKKCGMAGDAVQDDNKQLNQLKNRYSYPRAADYASQITLEAILEPGDDEHRWNTGQAAEITGYVVKVKPGGVETCNCHATQLSYRDTHIEVVADPEDADVTKRVIVEVTPRLRAKKMHNGDDWSTAALENDLEGHWVTFKGWMFWDAEHADEAENTAPGRSGNWRATAWEIHPVTAIYVNEE